MKTRKHRGRIDVQQRETPFFSKIDDQANVGAKAQEGFFQPKLAIGKPGDRFEEEADKAADGVVNGARSGPDDVSAVRKKEKVQGQAEEEEAVQAQPEEEEEAIQAQAEEEDEAVQAQPEEEEETVQAQTEEEEETVQAQPEEEEETVQAQTEEEDETVQAQPEEEEEAVQAQPEEEEETVQAQAEEEEETVQTQSEKEKEAVQPQAEEEKEKVQTTTQLQPGSPAFAAKLQQQQGKGHPLPPKVRAEMEASFDADFGAVRIHTGEEAAQLSKLLGAQALTHGNDIFFNEGKFNPESSAGKHLLAHELTHTLQQGKSRK